MRRIFYALSLLFSTINSSYAFAGVAVTFDELVAFNDGGSGPAIVTTTDTALVRIVLAGVRKVLRLILQSTAPDGAIQMLTIPLHLDLAIYLPRTREPVLVEQVTML